MRYNDNLFRSFKSFLAKYRDADALLTQICNEFATIYYQPDINKDFTVAMYKKFSFCTRHIYMNSNPYLRNIILRAY